MKKALIIEGQKLDKGSKVEMKMGLQNMRNRILKSA